MKKKNLPIVVSVINLKGGVGKTTVATLLARYASKKELNVLAIDMDPQSNFSQSLMTEYEYKEFMESGEPSIVELFRGYKEPSRDDSSPTEINKKHLFREVNYNDTFHLIPSRFDFSDRLIERVKDDPRALARFLARRGRKKDIVLIDCSPTESTLTVSAYHASRFVLVPVRTEFLSTIGFPLLKRSLDRFKGNNPQHAIDVCGVLINNSETRGAPRGPHHRRAHQEIKEEATENGWPIMKEEMFMSRGYPKLMREVYPSHVGNATWEFQSIAKEFFDRVGLG